MLTNCMDFANNPNITEDVTFTLILEEGEWFSERLAGNLEIIMAHINNFYNEKAITGNLVKGIPAVDGHWLRTVEDIFQLLDDDEKGYLSAEDVLYLFLSLIQLETVDRNPDSLRKRVAGVLHDMAACNGSVSLRSFKVYLLIQGITSTIDVVNLKLRVESLAL
jgi:hypothetical protein